MLAAFCLAEEKVEMRSKYSYSIRQSQKWGSGNKHEGYHDYFFINQEKYKEHGGMVPPTILIRKKNIKQLKDICQKIWVYEVSASFSPNTTLGFEEWLESKSNDDILELLYDWGRKNKREVKCITDASMYVRDVVIVYPKKLF
jgi:hypothetical protein